MAHCARCNRFMLLNSASGYCKDCFVAIVAEKERARREEEQKRREEEERRRKQEEENRRRLEAEEAERRRQKEEEERKRREEEERKRKQKEEEEQKRKEERKKQADKMFSAAKKDIENEDYEAALSKLRSLTVIYSEHYSDEIIRPLIQESEAKRTEQKYQGAVKNLEDAEELWQIESARDAFVSLGSYRDSEAKVQECKKKKASIEEAIEKQRRIEAEMREREEKKRREEEEKTIVMRKCSLRLPYTYDICHDLRSKGLLLVKDKETGKIYCSIKEISLPDEYLENYFPKDTLQNQDKNSLRYLYAKESVLHDPFYTSLGETEWLETSLGRVMINQLENQDKQRFYSCIIFFDELELVIEYYPAEFSLSEDLQTITEIVSTIEYGSKKAQVNSKTVSPIEATKKAEAWMVKSENLGSLYFFSMWLANHGASSLKQQMILKFREKEALTEEEIEAVDYLYLIREIEAANPF